MKRILISIFLFFAAVGLYGQSPINIGLKFGTNSSSLITDVNDFFEKSEVNHYFAGAFLRAGLGRMYIQPEVYFNTKGGDISTSIYDLTYQTIDIPVLIGVNLIKKPIFNLRAFGGPVLSYITTAETTEFLDFNIDELKDNYIGIQAGIGFDLWFVTIDARIENSFNIFIDDSNYSATNRMFLISAGIKLF
jgi:hypothetical protein